MSASLRSEFPDGGIRGQNIEADFHDLYAGRTGQQRVAIVVLEPNGTSLDKNQAGVVKKVKYLAVHMAEVRDPHEADQLRHRITQIRAGQGLEVSQPSLFAASEAEQCEGLIDLIKDWASEQDIPIAELDKRWWSYFGGAEADGLSETIQACRSVLQLKEFAYEIGAIKDEKPEEPETEAAAEKPTSDEPETETSDEAEPVASGVASVPFQDVTA